MSSGNPHHSRPFPIADDDPDDTLDPALDRAGTLVYRDGEVVEKPMFEPSRDETTKPHGGLERTPDGAFVRRTGAQQAVRGPGAPSPFAPQPTPFPMANRPQSPVSGAFQAPSFTPAHGVPQPSVQPGFQTGFQTGANPAISPPPGFQTGANPAIMRPQQVLKPAASARSSDEADPAMRVKFALVSLVAGAFIGGVLGIVNAKIQGWTIAQGSSQLFTLALAMALVFGAIAFFRPDRIEELLVHHGVLKLEETSLLSKKAGTLHARIPPSARGRDERDDDTLPPF